MTTCLRMLLRATVMAALLMPTIPAAASDLAQIRYTSHGIPHIKAADFDGAGFGLGYAFAKDNLCITVELALTLAGERSAAFGEDSGYLDPHVGSAPVRNLDSDFYAKFVFTDAVVSSMRAQLSADARGLVAGYVRGFNRYLAETPEAQRPQACRDAAWVRQLTEADIYRRINQIAVLQGTHVFLRSIAGAHAVAADPHTEGAGSNMAAFGRRATSNGRGLSFANPHFPWTGPQRFYAAQLTVPGKYDVFGGMLYGTPFILLGFNKDVGWSITYSTNQRLSLTRVRPQQLEAVQISVPARTATGKSVVRARTMYRSPDGPAIDDSVFPRTTEHAYVVHDANRDLGRWPDQFLAFGKAATVQDIRTSAARIRGVMFSNIAAADRSGKAIFLNYSTTINMPDADLTRCLVENGEQILRERFVVVLDGSRKDCGWRNDGDAVQPQMLPVRRLPSVMREDYVLNANDSHWLVNADPASALEGFDRVVGRERSALGDRTRTGLRMVERRLAGADGLDGNTVSLEALRRLFYRGETVIGESIRDDVVRDCRERSPAVPALCDALAKWDGTARPDSQGAALAREFIERLPREPRSSGMTLAPESWRVRFDRARPLDTPAGLIPSEESRNAFTDAAASLNAAGLPLTAPLRDLQFLTVNGQRLAVGGFPYTFLRFNATAPSQIYGDSYIHAVTFDEHGPVADFALAYSQSTDPQSIHSWDLTLAYAQQRWIRVPFLDRQIRHDPDYREISLHSRR